VWGVALIGVGEAAPDQIVAVVGKLRDEVGGVGDRQVPFGELIV